MESRAAKPAPEIVLYTRERCHLWEEAKVLLRELESIHSFQWMEKDIDQDEGLRAQFNDEVPVLFLGGRKAFRHRIDRDLFVKMLNQARSAAADEGF